jgi:hypothetical protein
MTITYTDSKGNAVVIADTPYPHLVNAHRRAVSGEERKHEDAAATGDDYSNPAREAEIDAMAAEIAKRDAAYAALKEAEE